MGNLRVVGVLLALAACDRGTVKSGPSCNEAADKIVAIYTKVATDRSTKEATSAVAKRCTEDKWSDDARTCITKGNTRDDLKSCMRDHLTGEQSNELSDATRVLGSSTGEWMARLHEFERKMCQCRDATCAHGVSNEMTKWGEDMANGGILPPKPSEQEMKEVQEIGVRMGDCMTSALAGPGDGRPKGL